MTKILNYHLNYLAWVWIQRLLNPASTFLPFSFFFFSAFTRLRRDRFYCSERQFLLFIYCFVTVHHCSSTVHTLKNIKNGSHNTIYTFKNYFTTVFLVFSFSNNKFNPNRPLFSTCFLQLNDLLLWSVLQNLSIS